MVNAISDHNKTLHSFKFKQVLSWKIILWRKNNNINITNFGIKNIMKIPCVVVTKYCTFCILIQVLLGKNIELPAEYKYK